MAPPSATRGTTHAERSYPCVSGRDGTWTTFVVERSKQLGISLRTALFLSSGGDGTVG
jgi:hypothetical protein